MHLDLFVEPAPQERVSGPHVPAHRAHCEHVRDQHRPHAERAQQDRKSTRLNSSHLVISYAVFCLKKKKKRAALLLPTRPRPPPASTTPARAPAESLPDSRR